MQFKATSAFILRGDRIRKGAVVDLTEEEAQVHAGEVKSLEAPAPEPEPQPEKALDEMTAAELKAKAAELGLSTTGSKADLVERITLHQDGADEEEISNDNE